MSPLIVGLPMASEAVRSTGYRFPMLTDDMIVHHSFPLANPIITLIKYVIEPSTIRPIQNRCQTGLPSQTAHRDFRVSKIPCP